MTATSAAALQAMQQPPPTPSHRHTSFFHTSYSPHYSPTHSPSPTASPSPSPPPQAFDPSIFELYSNPFVPQVYVQGFLKLKATDPTTGVVLKKKSGQKYYVLYHSTGLSWYESDKEWQKDKAPVGTLNVQQGGSVPGILTMDAMDDPQLIRVSIKQAVEAKQNEAKEAATPADTSLVWKA